MYRQDLWWCSCMNSVVFLWLTAWTCLIKLVLSSFQDEDCLSSLRMTASRLSFGLHQLWRGFLHVMFPPSFLLTPIPKIYTADADLMHFRLLLWFISFSRLLVAMICSINCKIVWFSKNCQLVHVAHINEKLDVAGLQNSENDEN